MTSTCVVLFSATRRIDSIAFHRLSKKYFRHAGHGGSWGEPTPRITDSERELLSGVGRQTVAMPPGTIPNPTKKKIRPSSAAANIQTHKSYTTALYDNVRPSTAAVTSERTPHGGSTGTQRPVTHAGGPRYGGWGRSNQDILGLEHKLQRRLTVGAVDGLADTDAALRPGALRPNIGSLLKEKVGIIISLQCINILCYSYVILLHLYIFVCQTIRYRHVAKTTCTFGLLSLCC